MTLRRSFFWSFSQQVGTMLLQFINIVVIARLLTPEEVGVFVIALAIVTILQSLREMGLTTYLIQERELQDSSIQTTFGMSIVLCSAIAAGLYMLRWPLETGLGTPGLAEVLLPVSLVVLLFPLEQPAMALIRRNMRFMALHNITITAKLASVITSISLAYLGFSTMALAWGLTVEAGLRALLLAYAERRPLQLGPRLSNWRQILGFGSWMTGASLAAHAYTEINKLLIGGTLGAAPTALYDRALRLPLMASTAVFMPISRVVLSSFSEDLRRGRPIGDKVKQLVSVTTVLVWPIFVVLMILSEEVILFLLGPQWSVAAQMLPWLLLQQLILMALLPSDNVLVPSGRVRTYFFLRVAQLIWSVGTGWIALQWGLWAFVVSRPLVMIITVTMTWYTIAPVIQLKKREMLRIYITSAIVCAVAAVPVALWKYSTLSDEGPILFLLAALLISAACGLGTIYAFKHPLTVELNRIVKIFGAKLTRIAS